MGLEETKKIETSKISKKKKVFSFCYGVCMCVVGTFVDVGQEETKKIETTKISKKKVFSFCYCVCVCVCCREGGGVGNSAYAFC